MTVIASKKSFSFDSGTFTLVAPPDPGRAVCVVAAQHRVPPDMDSATFAGLTPSLLQTFAVPEKSYKRVMVAYWANDNLPSLGDHTIIVNSGIHTVFELTNWDGSSPELVTNYTSDSSENLLEFTSSSADSVIVGAHVLSAGSQHPSSVPGATVEREDGFTVTTSFEGAGPLSLDVNTKNTVSMGLCFNASASPTLSINEDLKPGKSFSFSYDKFPSVPAQTVSISDGTVTKTIAAVISDNGDGSGSGTATMPTLAELVSDGTAWKFGAITVELTV